MIRTPLLPLNDPIAKLNRLLLYSCFSLLFIGCKFWIIYSYGNATPFWDEWDGMAARLYKPFLDGHFKAELLTNPHNEHRIFTTYLLHLFLLSINKTWNPLQQMAVNACIHLLAILLLNRFLQKAIGNNHLKGLLSISLVLFCMPYGWENTLAGFQSQFYFVLVFSIATIWYTTMHKPLGLQWWGGILFGMLAFLSLASGILAVGASAFIGFICYFLNLRKTTRQLIASVILMGLFATGILLTPVIKPHDVYKVHDVAGFYTAAVRIFRWPLPLGIIGAIFRNLPMAVFIIYLLRKRPATTDRRWFLFASCIWSLMMLAAMAYGRATEVLSPRYKDLYIIAVFLNVACAITMADVYRQKYGYKKPVLALIGYTVCLLGAFLFSGFLWLPDELAQKKAFSLEQEKNVRNYVATGNKAHLLNKPRLWIPFPDPNLLASIIDEREIRNILPYNLRVKPAEEGTYDKFTNKLLSHYYIFLVPGIIILISLILLNGLYRTERSTHE